MGNLYDDIQVGLLRELGLGSSVSDQTARYGGQDM